MKNDCFKTQHGTPWGAAQEVEEIIPGVVLVSTPSHGGIHLDSDNQALIPEEHRREDSWYEEDCEIAIPILFIPGVMDAQKENAQKTFDHLYTGKDTQRFR